jgi:hypothetical protein
MLSVVNTAHLGRDEVGSWPTGIVPRCEGEGKRIRRRCRGRATCGIS